MCPLTAGGHKTRAIPAHVGRADDCERLIAQTVDRFGRLDVIVANAAGNPPGGAWSKVIETNLARPWRLARYALPAIARSGGGSMVMVSSITAFVAARGQAAYGVSKGG